MNQPERPLKNIAQIMALCAVSRRTVYNWVAKGLVEYVRTPGGRIRIYADSVLRKP